MADAERNQVFISYAHEDKTWCEAFTTMLAPAGSSVKVWDDGLIPVGEKWADAINLALDKARVGLLLVSPNFLSSSFITSVELQKLLDAARTRAVEIFWVPISSSLFKYTELAGIQACWDPNVPLDGLANAERNKAISAICVRIVDRFGATRTISKNRKDRLREQLQQHLGTKYAITDEISAGKFSILYRAEREQPKQAVAIKAFTASELDEWACGEFAQCVEHALNLRSATFIRIFDCAMDVAPEYLVSELVVGTRLDQYLRRYPDGVSLATAKSILLDLAIGIDELHSLGWERGEMCPSDVLIQVDGAARMSPVNFSNVLREQGHLTGNFLADRESLSYMTPERFYGDPVTKATDQYSLALLAAELLSGQSVKRVICACDLGFKEKLYSELQSGRCNWADRSPEFTGVLRRMLRVTPEERWPSMAEVVRRLRDIEVAESPQERARKKATSGYLQILSARGVKGEREFYNKFYRNLFSSADDIEAKFESLDMERQYKVLNLAIYWLLEFRPDSPNAARQLEQLAQRHKQLGLEPRHYDLFLEAFMKTLVDYEPDRERLDAWRATLAGGIEFMVESAKATDAAKTV
jgi:serine/threonine protein kinase